MSKSMFVEFCEEAVAQDFFSLLTQTKKKKTTHTKEANPLPSQRAERVTSALQIIIYVFYAKAKLPSPSLRKKEEVVEEVVVVRGGPLTKLYFFNMFLPV